MPATRHDDDSAVYTDADGVMRVTGNGIPLDWVTGLLEVGETAEDVVRHFDSLTVAQANAVADYFRRHRAEVLAYMRLQDEQYERARAEDERRFPSASLIERLEARRPDLFPPKA